MNEDRIWAKRATMKQKVGVVTQEKGNVVTQQS